MVGWRPTSPVHPTKGIGLARRCGSASEVIRAGDLVRFAADEEYWRGAEPKQCMTSIALHERAADGVAMRWSAHVIDEKCGDTPTEVQGRPVGVSPPVRP